MSCDHTARIMSLLSEQPEQGVAGGRGALGCSSFLSMRKGPARPGGSKQSQKLFMQPDDLLLKNFWGKTTPLPLKMLCF